MPSTSSSDSVARFRFNRTLDQLANKTGRGTELISLYVPPGTRIHEVLANLREESGTSENIKSRTTRQNVQDAYGILVIDGTEAVAATLRGRRVEIQRSWTSGIPGKSRAGGQSARRFERIREQVTHDYYKRVGQHFNEIMLAIPDLKGIMIGGPGPTKYVWSEGEYLQYTLKNKVLSVVDTSYTSEAGVEEVVEKSSEILKGVRYKEEKQMVQKFLYELGHETGKGVFGELQVQKYLEKGVVDTLLISEKLEGQRLVLKCKNCGNLEEFRGTRYEAHAVKNELSTRPCKKCGKPNLEIVEDNDIIDSFLDFAEKGGSKVEVISEETEEGRMLRDAFGKIAAVLRYAAN